MTSEEFWKDDPKLFSSYYKAFVENEKRCLTTQNYNNWLQGLYIYNSSQIALTDFGYGFLAGKRNPNKEKYPAEPFDLFGNKKQIQEKNKIKKRRENQANLNFWARIKG